MDEQTPAPAETPSPTTQPDPRLSEPLPPHPAFATVVKISPTRKSLPLALLIIILLAGIVGMYLWQHGKVNTAQAQIQTATLTINRLNNQLALQKQNTIASANSLPIPELGITVTLPKTLSDMTYAVTAKTTTGTTVGLSTLALISLDTSCTANQAPLGSLVKASGVYSTQSSNKNTVGSLVKQYTGYYIAYQAPQTTCSDVKTTAALAQSDIAALPTWSSAIQPMQ